jgi:hypothetical protein
MTVNPDKIISEARARIIWGEPSSSVRNFLTSNGIPAADAEAKIKGFYLERGGEIRKIGVRNLLIGLVVMGIAPGILYDISFEMGHLTRSILCSLPFVVYGAWKLVIGAIYLIRPQLVKKSISDIGEYDILNLK